jgi:ribonucleoside-diphosphate reductase alpha chain
MYLDTQEIILRSGQTCNLAEVVVRESDTLVSLNTKVAVATIIGTLQSSLTDFKYVSDIWRKNTSEECLLGVSLTGIADHPLLGSLNTDRILVVLEKLRKVSVDTNKMWAEIIGVNQSTAITAVKPSGTVSQLVDSASGIHPRYSEYYIRTVRADKKDPLSMLMKDSGFPVEDDVTKPDSTDVFSFPMKAPKSSVYRNDRTAIEQLNHWLIYKQYWCEHNPSITVYIKEHEWMEVGAWVYEHFDEVSGVSFLPHSDHSYKQAPYQEITEKEYNEAVKLMPKEVDWSKLSSYEKEDTTKGTQEYACTGGACEIVNI